MTSEATPTPLKSTGERCLTEWRDESMPEHLHRYALAATLCTGLDVLDIATGEGYGSHLLSKTARSVIGVDIAQDAVAHASEKYKRSNLRFRVGNAASIPVPSASIDIAVSFETLEHHDQHDEMMLELKRVLKPGGLLVMSTPDKAQYSDAREYRNQYHVKELYLEQFRELISRHFKQTAIYMQSMAFGSLVIPERSSTGFRHFRGDFSRIIRTC